MDKATLSEEDLNDPQRFSWTEGETLVWYISANSYEHYLEHKEHIHCWLVDWHPLWLTNPGLSN